MIKLSTLWSCCGLLLIGFLCSFVLQPTKKSVWMIGDSTMAIKAKNKYPETGWGVAFATKFDAGFEVRNKAKNGRSTKSCIHEGIWKEVYDGMQPGDYVFIQFGHNDEKVNKPGVGTTISEYKANLALFVDQTRSKKGLPILLTPIARRAFENGKLIDTHGDYPDAVRQVADSLNVPLIDLTQQTSALLAELGEDQSAALFLHLPEGHVNYPKGVTDNTHLNQHGAEVIAGLVTQDMQRQAMPLAGHLVANK